MSLGWSLYVDVFVLLALGGCAWLLWVTRTAALDETEQGDPLASEHDGIVELDNPLPVWWTWLFVLTLVFAVVYLVVYPGMGSFAGALGWSSTSEYEAEMSRADARYGPIFAALAARPIPELAGDEQAVEMGGRLFRNHCSTCHGSDARGGQGYPDLTDGDWLHGGAPETIVQTITRGRIGNMPPLAAAVGGDAEIAAMVQYVLSLSGRDHDTSRAASAAGTWSTLCAVCHGTEGRGNPLMGAPNLTDDIWLHGGRPEDIEYQIRSGRINQMPAHADRLAPEKIHLLATYVYSLSNEPGVSGGDVRSP